MALSGILRTWNEERGFGFIAPAQGGRELFVHISAFPRDGSRPTEGERLVYELGVGRDGKPQAVRVVRTAVGVAAARAPATKIKSRAGAGTWFGRLVLLAILITAGTYGVRQYRDHERRQALQLAPPLPRSANDVAAPPAAETAATAARRCDGRTHCSQMTSCAEAKWFLNNCPGTQMDGNRDGVPCEQQWCTGLLPGE